MEFTNQCAWTATITYNNESKTVSYPLTCEFSVSKSTGSASFCTLNIYNLGKDTRLSEHFRKDDQFEPGKFMILEFSAGYNGNFTTIFRGQISSATSNRRGTDVITTIQAVDFGHSLTNNKVMSATFKQGTSFVEAFDNIAGKLNYIQPSARGVLEGEFKTDTTFYGTPLQILNQITNNHTFVDNSALICLNNNEHLSGDPILLDSTNGLIDVPSVGNYWVSATTIFNPNLIIGRSAQLKTTTLDYYNDVYKIYSVNHQGTISAAVGGQRTSVVVMQKVKFTPNSNVNITQQTEVQGEKIVIGTSVASPGKIDVQNAYKYIREHNGAIPPWKINSYVSWADMIGHSNKPQERYSELTPEILANCIIIANDFRLFIGSSSLKGQSFCITSGWRSKANNFAHGGKTESRHTKGLAIDLYFTKTSTEAAYNNVFKPINGGWPWFTYKFVRGDQTYIHIQHGFGVGGAKRQ